MVEMGGTEGQRMWREEGKKYVPGMQSYLKVLQSGDTYFMNKKFCSLMIMLGQQFLMIFNLNHLGCYLIVDVSRRIN